MGGETLTPEFDVFISYRVATDLPHVELLHRLLQNAGMKVMPRCHRPRPALPPPPPALILASPISRSRPAGARGFDLDRPRRASRHPPLTRPRLLCFLGVVGQDES